MVTSNGQRSRLIMVNDDEDGDEAADWLISGDESCSSAISTAV